MTRHEFIKACEKVGCTLRDGKVMFGDMEFGTYIELGLLAVNGNVNKI